MKSLLDYELITEDLFYRSMHVLKYIETHPNMSDLDKEAIEATMMDALVGKGLVDPTKQSLDLKNLCICDNLDYYCYEEQPFVVGIPLDIKEKMREKALVISGSCPISVFFAKPASGVHYCIYDMNTAFSSLFDDFTFLEGDYDSPTREGVIAKDRPFVEVNIKGTKYLIDALTKRMFKSDEFKKKYNFKEKQSISKKEFDLNKKKLYKEQTTPVENNGYASILAMQSLLFDGLKSDYKNHEYLYEIEKSKEYFKSAFEEADKIKKEVENFSFSKYFK